MPIHRCESNLKKWLLWKDQHTGRWVLSTPKVLRGIKDERVSITTSHHSFASAVEFASHASLLRGLSS